MGITDENVIRAFDEVERHLFIESFMWDRAYANIALHLPSGQTISQPYTVAFQTQLLQIKPGDRVLEIGTGSGFQAAILDAMGARVYSVERQLSLLRQTQKLLERLAPNIVLYYGDGFEGFPRYAPYQKVIVTCAAPEVPAELIKQMTVGGIMVIPVGDTSQTMRRIVKTDEDNHYSEETFGNFVFVPMLKDRVK